MVKTIKSARGRTRRRLLKILRTSSSYNVLNVLAALTFFLMVTGFCLARTLPVRSMCPIPPLLTTPPNRELYVYPGPPAESLSRFTLILNSYHRQDLLRASIRHYAQCPSIEEIRVIWCEDGPPPVIGSDSRFFSSVKAVKYDAMPDSSLNNRFKPIKGLKTEGVMSIDDDIIVPCSDLKSLFHTWSFRKRQLVGFFPRAHTMKADCSYRYFLGSGTLLRGDYSIVLTKAAMMHRDYLEMYSNHMAQEIRDYVNEHRNCEDIALQLMVANATHEPPEFVNSLWLTDKGKGPLKVEGISSAGQHLESRTTCLNDLKDHYGGVLPLKTRSLSDHGSLLWIRLTPVLGGFLRLFQFYS